MSDFFWGAKDTVDAVKSGDVSEAKINKAAEFSVNYDKVSARCVMENMVTCKGDEVVQIYVGFKNSSVDRPAEFLRGFKRIAIESNEKCNVAY